MTASRIIVAERAAEREEALRLVLYWCLDAQANGYPLPEALDHAVLRAESLVDITDLYEDPPEPCKA